MMKVWKICQDNNIKDPGNIQPGTVINIRVREVKP